MPDSTETLPPADVEALCLLLRTSARLQVERIQALLDGATLAAEQVQDVRLNILQQGPENTASDLLLPVIITFVLESSIAGILAGVLASTVISPLIRTNRGLARQEFNKLMTMKSRIIKEANSLKRKASNIERSHKGSKPPPKIERLKKREDALRQRSQSLSSVDDKGEIYLAFRTYTAYALTLVRVRRIAPDYSVAALKSAKEAVSASQSPPKDILTPGATLLAQVQEWGTYLRMATCHLHDVGEMVVRVGLTWNDAIELLNDLDIEGFESTQSGFSQLIIVRDNFCLLCEAVIWANLYKDQLSKAGYVNPASPEAMENLFDQLFSGRNPLEVRTGIPTALWKYWDRRLGDFAYRSLHDTSETNEKSSPPTKSGNNVTPSKKQNGFSVLLYLQQVAAEFEKIMESEKLFYKILAGEEVGI